MILAGDVGGTKTLLVLCESSASGLRIVRDATFASGAAPSLDTVVDEFLRGHDGPRVTGACFGVAGLVVGRTARITNLTWTIDADALAAKLGGVPVGLLNDLQATALGTLALPPSAFAELQPHTAPAVGPHATIAVIAPGTGLGEALLVWNGDRYDALPSEAGHADFAPGSDEELELWRHLRARHGDHVSIERVLSGAGIGELYDFARVRSGAAEPAWLTTELATGDRNAAIAHVGLAERDPACAHALVLFAGILGAEAGNLALRGLSHGGVVLGGGIPPKLLPALQRGGLLARFAAKGRFGPWMRSLGVRICLESRAALFGAAHYAATRKEPS